jgi:N-acetylmuramic acid 6-phosphate etherase
MVHMRARNAKLRRRAAVIVATIVSCPVPDAAGLVEQADGDVKLAVLLGFGLTTDEAAKALERHDGNLRLAIKDVHRERGSSGGEACVESRSTAPSKQGGK